MSTKYYEHAAISTDEKNRRAYEYAMDYLGSHALAAAALEIGLEIDQEAHKNKVVKRKHVCMRTIREVCESHDA